jgi:hypothetical protein
MVHPCEVGPFSILPCHGDTSTYQQDSLQAREYSRETYANTDVEVVYHDASSSFDIVDQVASAPTVPRKHPKINTSPQESAAIQYTSPEDTTPLSWISYGDPLQIHCRSINMPER